MFIPLRFLIATLIPYPAIHFFFTQAPFSSWEPTTPSPYWRSHVELLQSRSSSSIRSRSPRPWWPSATAISLQASSPFPTPTWNKPNLGEVVEASWCTLLYDPFSLLPTRQHNSQLDNLILTRFNFPSLNLNSFI